jgi:hypothetical protein
MRFYCQNHDWLAVQEPLYLLSIPGMRESMREGCPGIEGCSQDAIELGN